MTDYRKAVLWCGTEAEASEKGWPVEKQFLSEIPRFYKNVLTRYTAQTLKLENLKMFLLQ